MAAHSQILWCEKRHWPELITFVINSKYSYAACIFWIGNIIYNLRIELDSEKHFFQSEQKSKH